jgi:hypothetical protein
MLYLALWDKTLYLHMYFATIIDQVRQQNK